MIVQHIVLVDFRPEVIRPQRFACVDRLQALEGLVPGMRAWRVGLNVDDLERSWDLGLTGEFDTLDDMYAYRAHPDHRAAQAFVDGYAAQTVGVDFEVPA